MRARISSVIGELSCAIIKGARGAYLTKLHNYFLATNQIIRNTARKLIMHLKLK